MVSGIGTVQRDGRVACSEQKVTQSAKMAARAPLVLGVSAVSASWIAERKSVVKLSRVAGAVVAKVLAVESAG